MPDLVREATISECGLYRYTLHRIWDPGAARVCFVGLNPSTADSHVDDPTIRRCVGFARSWGFGGIVMLNLFAFRATDPRVLMQFAGDRVGPSNDHYLESISSVSRLTIACWGAGASWSDRPEKVISKLAHPHHLGLTKDGNPRHPLYLKAETKPQRF